MISSASSDPFGVYPPDTQCIKPERIHVFNVTTYSGSNYTVFYSATLSRVGNFSDDPFNTQGFIGIGPMDFGNVSIFLNSSLLDEGMHKFSFLFCREGTEVNVTPGSLDVKYCIQAPIDVNVSTACPEEPYLVYQKMQKDNLFLYNVSISFVIGLLVLMLVLKRIFRK